MLFRNRIEAAEMLIPYLDRYKNKNCVVLAVPRGGVPLGYAIAKAYHLPLDLLMVKKIGHPLYPELAIGAVNPEGYSIDEHYDVSQSYIDATVEKISRSLKTKYDQLSEGHEPVAIENKTVIVVDDGVATGHTMLAGIKMLRKKNPESIVVAIPVAPYDTAEKIRSRVDDLICLYTPEPFYGVGQHYMDFSQVSDEEVKELLRNSKENRIAEKILKK